MSRSNDEVASVLERFGRLLQLTGDNPFRARAYLAAAAAVRGRTDSIAVLAGEDRLRDVPGVGPGIAEAIKEIVRAGSFASLDDLTASYPPSLLDLLALPGVGPKRVLKLFSDLGVGDLAGLEAAIANGSIRQAKGLGPRFEETVVAGLAAVRSRSGQVPIGIALPAAEAAASEIRRAWPYRVVIAGGVRRFVETVEDLILVVEADDPGAARSRLERLPIVASVIGATADRVRARLQSGHEVDLVLAHPTRFGSVLINATGSVEHVERLGPLPEEAVDEAAVYAARGLPWIPPELRLGGAEFERLDVIPKLITARDIKGELHAHSRWSDGTASIGEMAMAAAGRGYAYLGITDHSRGLGVANGLDAERLRAQRREIDGVESSVALLRGSEVEVARDGKLDFDEQTLAALDVVVASLHVGLRQNREMLTERLLGVIDNPNVDVIAHPSGRLLERRPGGDFDWDRVFAAAADRQTALEINADPARLDLNAELARRALAAGCLLTINCDAHDPTGFDLLTYGIAVARQAWATPDRVINTWPLDRLRAWLAARHR